jgi:hypothetical protein
MWGAYVKPSFHRVSKGIDITSDTLPAPVLQLLGDFKSPRELLLPL